MNILKFYLMPNVRKFARRDLKPECSMIGLMWVGILGTWVSGSLGTQLDRQAIASHPTCTLGALDPAGHGGLWFSAYEFELYVLWQLAYICWDLCFPH